MAEPQASLLLLQEARALSTLTQLGKVRLDCQQSCGPKLEKAQGFPILTYCVPDSAPTWRYGFKEGPEVS